MSFLSHEYYKRDWTDIPFNVARYEDTTFDYTYEYARLYSYDNDSYELTVIDEKLVHIENTPVTHWINAQYSDAFGMSHIPIYELYFEKGSYIVQDTF